MRGLVFMGEGSIAHRTDLPDPAVIDPGDALVAVDAAGLCGSDLHPYLGREPARAGVVPGHEVVGRVVEVGAEVAAVAVGDRVVVPFTVSCGVCGPCRRGLSARCVHSALFGWGDPAAGGRVLDGGQAELLRVPWADGTLVAVDESVPAVDALLLGDNLPTGWYAAARGEVGPGSGVAVVGLGAVGLCAIVAARAMGATDVVGVDPVEGRRARAAALDVVTCHPDDAVGVTADLRVDVAIEAAGPPAAQRLAAELVRPGGTVSIIAVQTDHEFGISPVTAYDRNLRITAGRAPVRSLLDELLPMVAAGRLQVPGDLVVTHPGRPLAEGPQLYRRFADRDEGLVKATFSP